MKIILNNAYWWECPTCKHESFIKAEEIDLEEEDIREILNLDEWEEVPEYHGIRATDLPEMISCNNCDNSFEVLIEEDEDDLRSGQPLDYPEPF